MGPLQTYPPAVRPSATILASCPRGHRQVAWTGMVRPGNRRLSPPRPSSRPFRPFPGPLCPSRLRALRLLGTMAERTAVDVSRQQIANGDPTDVRCPRQRRLERDRRGVRRRHHLLPSAWRKRPPRPPHSWGGLVRVARAASSTSRSCLFGDFGPASAPSPSHSPSSHRAHPIVHGNRVGLINCFNHRRPAHGYQRPCWQAKLGGSPPMVASPWVSY